MADNTQGGMTSSALGNGTEGPARWSLRLLGGFELTVLPSDARVTPLGKRERLLLAYLALSPNYRQPRRKLATLLWGDATDESLLDNLRACVWKLRKALGDSKHRVVASEGEDIVLDVAAFDVDALAFRRLTAQSDRNELETAAELYSGEFLDGLIIESEEFESWRRAEATRYRDQAIDVLTRLMSQFSECGDTERAVEVGERILRLEPLHEAALRRLMRLYGESGRRGAAVQLYRTFSDALRTELDAQPEAETRAVFAEIARGGEEQANGHPAAEAKPPPRSANMATSMAGPSDAPSEVLRPPARPVFRLRAPLAVLAGVLIVATAFISYRQFALVSTPDGVVAERTAAADPASAISIAVLPFLNLSGDAGQAFFSDGMTEEITSALAMVSDLKVVARTSAFQFKGEKNDMRAVGQALNATHLIEGSVRKDGNQVRISAQLIEAGSGTHLWSENYDRQLSDIFATQEEIARTIVGSLMAPLGLAPGERLVANRTEDVESYQQYLRARALVRARGLKPLSDAVALLEQVVAGDSNYAPAWALLALAHGLMPAAHPAFLTGSVDEARRLVDASLPRAEAAARRAIQLDAKSADGYVSLGFAQQRRGSILLAEELYSKALELDESNPDGLHRYSDLLADVGRLEEAVAIRRRLQAVEPFVPVFNTQTALFFWLRGEHDEAIAILKDGPPGGLNRTTFLAMIYAAMGRYGEAADALLEAPSGVYSQQTVESAARLLRTVPATNIAPQTLPLLGFQGFVYLYVGATDRVLDYYEAQVDAGYMGGGATASLWHSSYDAVRKLERFKAFVRKAGFVEYWRAKGWPEFCHPTTGDDFECN